MQGLEAVETHVGRAQLRPLHPVADPLQGGERLLEYAPVGGLVRLQHGRVRAPRESLLQRHARDHPGGGREGVHHQGLPLGAVDDHGGALPQVGLPSQLDLGSEVADEHAGDPQGVPPMMSSGSEELRSAPYRTCVPFVNHREDGEQGGTPFLRGPGRHSFWAGCQGR